jgi:hypothetical protein
MDVFEGYTGIRWENELLVHDVFLLLIIVLLALFAFIFHACYPLFEKMMRGFVSMKERQTLFDTPTKENFFFAGFMGFQTLFLCAVFFYLAYCHITERLPWVLFSDFIMLIVIFILLFLFYLLKQSLYFMYGRIAVGKEKYRLWQNNYHAAFYSWGIILYLPVLWLMFDHNHFTGILGLFVFSYIVFRFYVIYLKIRIFYHKYTGLLYFSLYLCAQEIVPLLFLYESLKYLHNVIETSILWQ